MKKISDEEVKRLVETEHFIHGKSLRSIERANGLSNDVLRKRCIKLGIKTKGRVESIRANQKYIVSPSGDDHWRRYNTKASQRLALLHSKNMKENNPSHNPETKQKITESLAITLFNNPTFHEKMFIEFLDMSGIKFKFQEVISKYIVDFLIDNVVIELDGRGHSSRITSDRVRDKALNTLGFYVVRVNQDSLFNRRTQNPVFKPEKLMAIIKTFIPYPYGVNTIIPYPSQYRVIVREANTATERVF